MSDPYVYKGTDILKNKLDILDKDQLQQVEYNFAKMQTDALEENPIKANFDFNHLKAIHKHIFQDIYDWAGKERIINMQKGSVENDVRYMTPFIDKDMMVNAFVEDHKWLEKNNFLKRLSKDCFVEKVAQIHTRIDEIHPFRDGNGRATRVFLDQLAKGAGYKLDWTKVASDKWQMSSAKALQRYIVLPRGYEPDSNTPNIKDKHVIFKVITQPIGNTIPLKG